MKRLYIKKMAIAALKVAENQYKENKALKEKLDKFEQTNLIDEVYTMIDKWMSAPYEGKNEHDELIMFAEKLIHHIKSK